MKHNFWYRRSTLRLYTMALMTIMLLMTHQTNAQSITLPYFCGFEDAAENSQWVLNSGANGTNATNKWYISDAEVYAGDSALIISDTLGRIARYSNVTISIVAYRTITLPAGNYDLSFTYKAGGEANTDGLYACWVTGTQATNSAVLSTPTWVINSAFTIGGKKMQSLTDGWKVATQTINSTGVAMKLVFVWVNNNTNAVAPGGCIDNVQISSTACGRPDSLTTTPNGSGITLSWTGNASTYDLMYRSSVNPAFTTVAGITGNSYTIQSPGDGIFDFMVRSNCQNDTSIWSIKQNVIFYDTTAHCINYVDLTGPATTCTYGTYTNPKLVTGVVDNGPSQKSSRHTVHTTIGETDPRTLNGLTTIPDGEVMSVRLGNWNNGSQGETVTYIYTVPTTSDNLIVLNYAVVYEEPGHVEEPEFSIQITDTAGQSLGACYQYTFFQWCEDSALWHLNESSLYSSYSDIYWKEWSKVGFNLSQFAGQTIKICLTNKDCNWAGHFGYAYFTLNCADAQLVPTSRVIADSTEYTAPAGFTYRWTNNSTGQQVSTAQTYVIAYTDPCTYTCRVTSKIGSNCGFNLTATGVQRKPESSFAYSITHSDCQSHVNFTNNSQVYELRNGVKSYVPQASVDSQSWLVQTVHKDRAYSDLVSGSFTLSQIDVPNTGDTLQVTLSSTLGNFAHDTTVTIIVPPLAEYYNTIDSTVCCGTPIYVQTEHAPSLTFTFLSRDRIEIVDSAGNRSILNDTVIHLVNQQQTFAGCDSTVEYYFRPYVTDTVRIDTTITAGTQVRIAIPSADDPTVNVIDTTLSTAGTYTLHATGSLGCDSLLVIVRVVVETGVEVIGEASGFNILLSPNPTAPGSKFRITCTDGACSVSQIEVYDIEGRCICRDALPCVSPNNNEIIITAPNTPGIYIIRLITQNGQTATTRLIIE